MKKIQFTVDRKMFERSVLLRAGHSLVNRCYVTLEEGEGETWVVTLEIKDGVDVDPAQAEGDFRNTLITEAFRDSLMRDAQTAKELIVARALFGADGQMLPQGGDAPDASLDDEFAFIDEELDDYLEDPLGIAIPWEERHQKKPAKGDDDEPAKGDDDEPA